MASSVYTQRGRRYTFRPYQPPPVPTGSYDPALDAQLRAGQRGLQDLTQDVETANTRGLVDYGLAQQGLQRSGARNEQDLWSQFNRTNEDLGRSRGRGLADIGTSRTRGREDYERTVGMLTRQYQQLGDRQRQGQNAAGLLRGGAALQAAAKRAENEALDRQPIDTNFSRFNADNTQAEQRLEEDFGLQSQRAREGLFTGMGRMGEDRDLALGQLGLGLQRGQFDTSQQLLRGAREQEQFGLDVGAQKMFQATQAGYVPPQRGEPGGMPKNEFVDAQGRHFKTIIQGNEVLRVDGLGRILSRRRR